MEAGSRQLDELSAARLAEGRAILDGLLARYVALKSAAIAERDGGMSRPAAGSAARDLETWLDGDPLAGLSVEQSRCLLFALAERLTAYDEEYPGDGRNAYSVCHLWFVELSRRPLALVAGDVRLLAALAAVAVRHHVTL